MILALAPDAIESYENLATLFCLVNLNALCGIAEYCLCSDLKCLMVILGLQTCSAFHPCPWCDTTLDQLSQKGISRTFTTINNNYRKWQSETKENKAKAKLYGNQLSSSFYI